MSLAQVYSERMFTKFCIQVLLIFMKPNGGTGADRRDSYMNSHLNKLTELVLGILICHRELVGTEAWTCRSVRDKSFFIYFVLMSIQKLGRAKLV
jgi:ferredoxin-thioredoxin reductase catalytic subunit